MRMIRTIAVLFVAGLIMSCGRMDKEVSYSVQESQADMAMSPARGAGTDLSSIDQDDIGAKTDDKKIIKDGRMGIRVKDIAQAKASVMSLVDQYNGYFSSDTYNDAGSELSYTLVIRIPNANYEPFVAALDNEKNGKLLYKEITARDVTEQYLDIQTRLANKRVYLARYQELVKRAGTIKEVLEVEEQIRVLEEEIESAEGRLRYLGDQVSYSTLNLTLSQQIAYVPVGKESSWGRFKGSVVVGWKIIVEIFYVIIKLWPLLFIAGGVLVLVRRRRRRKASTDGK